MSQDNKALTERWFEEVWNKGRAEAIREMVTEDLVIHGLSDAKGEAIKGVKAFDEFHSQFVNAFPNIQVTVDDLIAEGDKVAARCTVRAKHTGDALGVAATHADVDFTGIAIVRINGGKIVEAWNNFDFMKMNRQLGII
ncbi:MAG TPA: ester cyclase [Pyrinomonadaceae bacterium]|nr:ester cyclase [Pyrinomonadaceae bacterium]